MIPAPVSTDTAEHYVWGSACDGWHLVRAAGLSVIEERMPAGASERNHSHRQARQFFYVLDGELTMHCGADSIAISARHGIEIAPGVVHQARNNSTSEVRFLVISQPPSHGDRVDAPADF